jgi:cyclic pyranopterin phosphate synthase
MSRLTHLDAQGRARMVDVGAKAITDRECVARGVVRVSAPTLDRIREGTPKGDVLSTARLAGIQAAKRTSDWIPLAHQIPLDLVEVDLELDERASCVHIVTRVRATAKTGVEMEALVAACAAGLTIYDMCKAVDRGISIGEVELVRKSGGKSGSWERKVAGPDPG